MAEEETLNNIPDYLHMHAKRVSTKLMWLVVAVSIAFLPTLSGLWVHGLEGLVREVDHHETYANLTSELMIAIMVALVINAVDIYGHTFTDTGAKKIRPFTILNFALAVVYLLTFGWWSSTDKAVIDDCVTWAACSGTFLAGIIAIGFFAMLEIENDIQRYESLYAIVPRGKAGADKKPNEIEQPNMKLV